MKKKWIWITLIVGLLIAILSIVVYKEITENNMETKAYELLRDKGYNSNDIDDVDAMHSFISNNKWKIDVEFETDDDIIFVFTYENNDLVLKDIKNEKYKLTKEEIQEYENKYKTGKLKYNK